MRSNQKQQWNDNNGNTQPVGLGAPGAVIGFTLFDGGSDLVGERAGNRAGEISRAHRFSASKTQEFDILGGSTAVTVSGIQPLST